MWAPRRIADGRLVIADSCPASASGLFINRLLAIRHKHGLKSLGVPIRFLQAPFAGVFEKLVDRRKQDAGSFHVQPHTEIEFVVQKMNIAMPEHAEERAGCLEIIRMNDSLVNFYVRASLVGDAVAAPGDNVIEDV